MTYDKTNNIFWRDWLAGAVFGSNIPTRREGYQNFRTADWPYDNWQIVAELDALMTCWPGELAITKLISAERWDLEDNPQRPYAGREIPGTRRPITPFID